MSDKEKRIQDIDDLDEDWGEESEEENSPLKSFLTFLILVAIAAIICTIVWVTTHRDGETQAPVKPETNTSQTVNETLAAPEVKQTEESTEESETEESAGIEFSMCSDIVTPKEYVNLRTEPSTDGGDATVYCQVSAGEQLNRTGYNTDYGWSRVEYDGQVLYVVSSYVEKVE